MLMEYNICHTIQYQLMLCKLSIVQQSQIHFIMYLYPIMFVPISYLSIGFMQFKEIIKMK